MRLQRDTLQVYLASVRRYGLLDAAEEGELARRWRDDRDERAFHRLVNGNLRFVVHLANRYRTCGFPMMDLIQEGNTGLVRAVHKFDPDRHIRLVSYASWWIRAYIHAYILRSWSLVKLGTTDAQRRLFFSIRKAAREIDHEEIPEGEGEAARRRAIAARCGVREEDVAEMEQRLYGRDVSMNRSVDAGDTSALEDVLADDRGSPEESVAHEELSLLLDQRLGRVLEALNARERYILERRVLSDDPLRLREIGVTFGVTRERVRQIESEARGKLRRGFRDLRTSL